MRYLVDRCGFELSLRTAVSCRVVRESVWFVHYGVMCLMYSIFIQELGTATHALQYTLHTRSHIHPHRSYMYHTHTHVSHKPATHYNSKQCTVAIVHTLTCSPTAHHHQHSVHLHSVHLYKLLAVYCIDHVPPNPQDGCTPLMVAAVAGHLPLARLLVETYKCDVNEEDSNVSGWELMGGVSEHSTCVSSHMWPSDTGSWNTRCTFLMFDCGLGCVYLSNTH